MKPIDEFVAALAKLCERFAHVDRDAIYNALLDQCDVIENADEPAAVDEVVS